MASPAVAALMRRTLAAAAALAALVIPLGIVTAYTGSGQASVQVEPASIDAGATVVFAGTGLRPDSDRDLVLAGDGMVIDFGVIKTDATGTFSKELHIPGHVPNGTFELRAIGDETLTVPLQIAGTAAGVGGATSAAQAAVGRSTSGLESAAFLGTILALVVAGGLVVWKAERLNRTIQASRTLRETLR